MILRGIGGGLALGWAFLTREIHRFLKDYPGADVYLDLRNDGILTTLTRWRPSYSHHFYPVEDPHWKAGTIFVVDPVGLDYQSYLNLTSSTGFPSRPPYIEKALTRAELLYERVMPPRPSLRQTLLFGRKSEGVLLRIYRLR